MYSGIFSICFVKKQNKKKTEKKAEKKGEKKREKAIG